MQVRGISRTIAPGDTQTVLYHLSDGMWSVVCVCVCACMSCVVGNESTLGCSIHHAVICFPICALALALTHHTQTHTHPHTQHLSVVKSMTISLWPSLATELLSAFLATIATQPIIHRQTNSLEFGVKHTHRYPHTKTDTHMYGEHIHTHQCCR